MSNITEKVIQDYIWENRNNLYDLIDVANFRNEIPVDKPWEIKPYELIYNNILSECIKYFEAIKNSLSLFTNEVGLKKENQSTIRADLLGILDGQNGICIIEVKKSAQTERQAFTELLAYGSHIRHLFSPLSTIDIKYILISPMQERIVKESVINNIIYERKFTFALIPEHDGSDIKSLRLKPWIPELKKIEALSNSSFCQENFDVAKIVWSDIPEDWNPESGKDPDIYMQKKMNLVAQYTAQIMERKGIHGFVYSSQVWSEHKTIFPLTNSLIIVGLNPYKATKNRVLLDNNPTANVDDIKQVSTRSLNMLDIIPEIKQRQENLDRNFFFELSETWINELFELGIESVKRLTQNYNKKHISINAGSFQWKDFQSIFVENGSCHIFDIYSFGIIREILFEYIKIDYDFMKKNSMEDHLIHAEAGISEYMIEVVNEYWFLSNVIIDRMSNQEFYIEE